MNKPQRPEPAENQDPEGWAFIMEDYADEIDAYLSSGDEVQRYDSHYAMCHCAEPDWYVKSRTYSVEDMAAGEIKRDE